MLHVQTDVAAFEAEAQSEYNGSLSPADRDDELWHEGTTKGDWIKPAREKHMNAHHSEQDNQV